MYTDIIGNSMDSLHNCKQYQKCMVAEFEGQCFREIGSGVLFSFANPVDAVYCSLELQDQLLNHQELQLKIGLHLVDAAMNDYGNIDLDIPTKLQTMAEPGGIYLSEAVQNAIQGQSDINSVYLGELQLKHEDYRVKIYALKGHGLPPVIEGAAKRLSSRFWTITDKKRNQA